MAAAVEDLYPHVASIRDVDMSRVIQCDSVRQIEFARAAALRSPLEQECSRRRKFHHAGIAIAIAHEKATVCCHRHVGRPVEMRGIIPRDATLSKG